MTRQQPDASGANVHQQKTLAERQADAERYADEAARGEHGFPEMLRALLNRDDLVNDQVRTGLAGDGAMRLAPPIPARNYLSEPHETLEQSVKESADPGIVGEVGTAWTDIGQGMIGFQAEFASAVDASRDHWSGQAGDAARRFLVGVGEYIGKAGASAQLAGVQAQEHSRALQSAQNSMPPVVEWDMRAAIEDIMRTTDPAEYERKVSQFWVDYHAQRAAHEEAARVAGVFDRSISGASVLPAFPPPPQLDGGDDGGPSDPRPKPDQGRSDFRPPADLGQVPSPDGRGEVDGLAGQGGRDSSVPGRPDGIPTPELTDPESFIPSPVDVNVATGNPGVQGGGGGGGTPVGGLPIGGRSGVGPDSGGTRGGGVSRGTAGYSGAGGRGAAGPPGGAPRGFGSRAGAAAGAAVEGRGAGGGRGSGTGGMPMGGGRGQGGEDTEHTRPEYLVEAEDPESLFGTDEATAPPVIGG